MNERQLFQLKEDIESAKKSVAQHEGHLNAIKKQLQDEWDCSTVEEVRKKIEEMETELDSIDTKINKGLKELEEKYNVQT